MNTEAIWTFLSTEGADFGLKILAAIAAWVVGRWLISLALRVFTAALERGRRIDSTLAAYLRSILSVLLNVVLILAILDIFGVKTTSFAALLAGAGLAIGTAWGGLLTHFAAGVFMQVLRPFKVGDFVQAGGVTGTVTEIGLFGTTINTPDNVHTIVGKDHVDVRDDGPGVPDAIRDRLFEPFATAREGGTGLGLALAQRIARAHGGRLTLLDEPGDTTFRVSLSQR